MKLNYIMLPEDFRPRPGHRHRVKKVSKTFSPMSMAGRWVQSETNETASVAGNAEKEEDRAEEFTKFVKTLNRKMAAQRHAPPPAVEVVEVDPAPRSMKTVNRLSGWLARSTDAANSSSRLSRKREAAKSATESIRRRAHKRVKEVIASRAKLEDIPRPYNPLNQIQIVANVIDPNDTNQHQSLVDPTDTRSNNGGILYHQLPSADTIQNQFGFGQHFVHGAVTPGLSHNVVAHQGVVFPRSEIHNHDYVELEHTAIGCAYMGMDEPMDICSDFPSRVANDDYRDLEYTAIRCAYAAMDEHMDITLDDTQGPMAHAVHQNIPPFIGFVGHPQQRQFDHAVTFQQPVYETIRPPDHQYLIDQDYHLWPPAYAHIHNQVVPPQPHQEWFVNENLPLHQYYQAGHYPQGEEYLGGLPELGHHAPIYPVDPDVFYEQGIPGTTLVQQQAEIHHQPIGYGVHFHPTIQEGRVDQGRVHQHLNGLELEHDLGVDWNAGGGWQYAGEEGQYDDTGYFVDVFGENAGEQGAPNRHTAEAHILDPTWPFFGDNGEDGGNDDDDDDDDEDELQIIF